MRDNLASSSHQLRWGYLTETYPLEHVHLVLARDLLSRQVWMFVSDQPTTLQTFQEYGKRFQIEEELLDEKSNGFQLERSELRSAPVLSRLCLGSWIK